jgi:CubicO group peptidase (beta-lactamase class C family)
MKRQVAVKVLWLLALSALCFSGRPANADAIDDYLDEIQQKLRIPGLVLTIMEDGHLSLVRTRGHVSLEFEVPTEVDDVFELASLTKQFTAAAIMLLVQEGRLQLDDDLTEHLPEQYRAESLDHWNGITIRHLLTHTSGLPDRFEWRLQDEHGNPIWLQDYSTDDLFRSAAEIKPELEPGKKFQYSDAGYFLLGIVIEEVTGQDYREFLKDAFFDKLGMASTDIHDQRKVVKELARAYQWDEDNCSLGRDRLRDVREELPSHYGVMSNALDLVRWEAELNEPRILAKSSLEEMWRPTTLNDGQQSSYGFGWMLGRLGEHKMVDHSGITGTYYMRVPKEEFALVLLTNRSWIAHPVLREIGVEIVKRYKPEMLGAASHRMSTGAVDQQATRCSP